MEAEADLIKCGAGKGPECCIYLVVGSDGPECGREIPDIKAAVERMRPQMSAQRKPVKPFPECQEEGRDGEEN